MRKKHNKVSKFRGSKNGNYFESHSYPNLNLIVTREENEYEDYWDIKVIDTTNKNERTIYHETWDKGIHNCYELRNDKEVTNIAITTILLPKGEKFDVEIKGE